MKNRLFLVLVLICMALVACGGGGGSTESENVAPVGDAAHGEELYRQTTIGDNAAPGCVTCHSLEANTVLVGPSHNGVAARAGAYVEGVSAEDYLRESILDPDAHVVEGFAPGVMYQNYAQELQARDVNDLVAFLLTLN